MQKLTLNHTSRYLLYATVGAVLLLCLGVSYFVRSIDLWQMYKADRIHIASIYYERGNYYFGDGDYDIEKALRQYETALRFENKANDPIHYQIGRIYFIKGELRRAIAEFDTQLKESPEFMRTYYMRGLSYGYLHEYAKAEADFKKFIEWKPTSWAAHNDLAWVYFIKGDYVNAEKYARAGLEAVPENPWLSNALGAVLINTKRSEESLEYLTSAKLNFEAMTAEGWGLAYPGNDPRIYEEGYRATLRSVEQNITAAKVQGVANFEPVNN